MNIQLSIPFNDDYQNFGKYRVNVIEKYQENINNIYYALPVEVSPNARSFHTPYTLDDTCRLTEAIRSKNINPMIVLNSSWSPLTAYTNGYLNTLYRALQQLIDAGLYGVTIQNNYLMTSGMFEHLPGLHIGASINQMIDTYDKANNLVNILPYKGIAWCRNINPNKELLAETNKKFKEKYPNVTTTVLLNEGCMLYCPFKREHDNFIGMLSYIDDDLNDYNKAIYQKYPELNDTLNNININMGCLRMFAENPELKKLSPYITPEEFQSYVDFGCADVYKIAGRTSTIDWIAKTIEIYLSGKSEDGVVYLDTGIGGKK